MKPAEFVQTYGPLAEDIGAETGLQPKAVLGIVAQETGWGDHFVGNNIFGISPDGPKGQYVAQYPTIQDASRAFVDLVKRRYSGAAKGESPEEQVALIAGGGYNTSRDYAGSVIKHIHLMRGMDKPPPAANDDAKKALLDRINADHPPPGATAPAEAPTEAPQGAAEGGPGNRGSRGTVEITIRPRGAPGAGEATPPPTDPAAAKKALLDKLNAEVPPAGGKGKEPEGPPTDRLANIGAGAIEGAQGTAGFLSDPYGVTANALKAVLGSAYEGIAPHVGLPPMTPGQRRTFYDSDSDTALTTQASNALLRAGGLEAVKGRDGTVRNRMPENVVPGDTLDRVLRAGTAGAVGGTLLPTMPGKLGNLLAMTAGGTGAVTGEELAHNVPEWAQPGAEVLGNVLGAGIFLGAPAAAKGINRLSQGGIQFPEGVSPLSPEGARIIDAARDARTAADFARRKAAGTLTKEEILQERLRAIRDGGGGDGPGGGAPGELTAEGMAQRALTREGEGPQPAGAEVTTAPIPERTPAERVAWLEQAVRQTAEDRAGPQLKDDYSYVPGIPGRRLAGRDFSSSQAALDEAWARGNDPAFRDRLDAHDRARNAGMKDLLEADAGTGITLERAHEFRSEVSPKEMGVFAEQKPTDASGLLAKVDDILHGEEGEGKRGAVQNVIGSVRAALFDRNGNLETLPSRLYGVRKHITDLLQKGVKGTGEMADDVRATREILRELLEPLDEVITGGADKFKDYLAEWRARSIPIDQMEFLQKYQSGGGKITGGDGYLQFNKVQKMLDDVLQAHKREGNHPAKSLTDEQIQNIEAVRNELATKSLQDRLESGRGSPTFQRLSHPFGGEGVGGETLRRGIDVAGTIAMPGVYNWVLKPGAGAVRDWRARGRIEARKNQLMEPPPPNVQ